MIISRRACMACILLMFFLAASVTNGVCICTSAASAAPEQGVCSVVSLDVCGTAAAGFAVHAFDGVSDMSPAGPYYYPVSSIIPPEPCESVASAEQGETGKPPEA